MWPWRPAVEKKKNIAIEQGNKFFFSFFLHLNNNNLCATSSRFRGKSTAFQKFHMWFNRWWERWIQKKNYLSNFCSILSHIDRLSSGVFLILFQLVPSSSATGYYSHYLPQLSSNELWTIDSSNMNIRILLSALTKADYMCRIYNMRDVFVCMCVCLTSPKRRLTKMRTASEWASEQQELAGKRIRDMGKRTKRRSIEENKQSSCNPVLTCDGT